MTELDIVTVNTLHEFLFEKSNDEEPQVFPTLFSSTDSTTKHQVEKSLE